MPMTIRSPCLRAVPCDLTDVLTEEGLASAQHNDRFSGLSDLVDDAECLLRGEHSVLLPLSPAST